MKVTYVRHGGDDLEPLEAARMSTANPTGVDPVKDDRLRERLWRDKHASPFEFPDLTVEIEAPLFVRSQIFRHRVFSVNEFSLRYSEHDAHEWEAPYWVPDAWRAQDRKNKQMSGGLLDEASQRVARDLHVAQMEAAFKAYEDLLALGVSREMARGVLPQSTYTRWRQKGSLRAWFGFFDLRLAPDVQPETQVIAQAVAGIVREHFPKCFEVWEAHRRVAA